MGTDTAAAPPPADAAAVPASTKASGTADTDADLHDVFRSLYAGDEWASDDESDDGAGDGAAAALPAQFARALDDLILPSPSTRKRRIYPDPKSPPTTIASTSALPPLPAPDTYAPFSPLPLLARLRTYKPATYPALLPPSIGATAAALAGWTNAGAGGLACACGARWGVSGLDAIADPRVRAEVVRRLAGGLGSRHNPGCGWRVHASPPQLVAELRRFAHPLVAASLEPLARALLRRSLAGPVRPAWRSPAAQGQLEALATALQAYGENRAEEGAVLAPLDALPAALALFGWYPYDPGFAADADHVTPGKGTPTDIVACRLCQRRVGMWAFQPKDGGAGKVFDLQTEHISWCPLRADDWWRECVRLQPVAVVEREGAADIVELLRVSESPRPAKKWRKGKKK
ncbi:hypothetical protein VHUM_02496 [Vanrija humicola]|uniref:C3HC-type domain-containing protein n=1 Tax=Vanrija humicola TaxID=5417 RepID=A0A7D8Z2P0_VANHU|nr:hypothetical protein VHUM_02496 [Vanrija humicola]